MPFDTTNFDYTKVTPVYDKDNPPKRMSEAIRMAVADVEAAIAAGFKWDWTNVFDEDEDTKVCSVCTAGAVVQRLFDYDRDADHIDMAGDHWESQLWALSELTAPRYNRNVFHAHREWPAGFAQKPVSHWEITPCNENPEQFKADMLALADRLEAEGS